MIVALRSAGRLAAIVVVLAVAALGPAQAFAPMQGCFVADAVCPAPSSIRHARNPGGLATAAGRAYPLLGANQAERASHFQIRIPGAQPPARWVAVGCGRIVAACAPGRGDAAAAPDHVLAASWQPAFCERHMSTPECRAQTAERFDATHFALHGLWPQPRDNVYCGVSRAQRAADEAGRWHELPPLALSEVTRAALARVMPGTRSALHRHEWLKHGTCSGASAEAYFARSLQLMAELNRSPVRTLLAARIGQRVTAQEVRAAFDQAFGPGAGARVALGCADGLITELLIHLRGALAPTTGLADLLAAAAPVDPGCPAGRIDRAG